MTRSIRVLGLTAAMLFSFGLLACGQKVQSATSNDAPARAVAEEKQSGSATEIKIDNFSFTPQSITVAAGTTVTWTNHDDVPHNVVSSDKFFKSKTMYTDEKFSYTFGKPGTYSYFCSIHPRMTATVVVK